MHFEMSSAICFNLDQSKLLSSGNGLTNVWEDVFGQGEMDIDREVPQLLKYFLSVKSMKKKSSRVTYKMFS